MVHEWMHAIDVLESNQGVGRRLPCVVAAVDEVGLDEDQKMPQSSFDIRSECARGRRYLSPAR
jgi:hypothetical protein